MLKLFFAPGRTGGYIKLKRQNKKAETYYRVSAFNFIFVQSKGLFCILHVFLSNLRGVILYRIFI